MKVQDQIVSLIGLKTSSRSEVQIITLDQECSMGIFREIVCLMRYC